MEVQNEFPAELIKALKNNAVLPIVAAGVSISVIEQDGSQMFPSWFSLLEKAADKLDNSDAESKKIAAGITAMLNLGDYQMAADLARKGLVGQPWFDFFKEQFKKDLTSVNLDLAKAIWRISNSIITLNYDKVMERSCHDVNVSVYDNNSRAELCRFSEGDSKIPELWHLHGRIDNIGEIVFTSESYEGLYKQSSDISDKYKAAITRLNFLSSTKTFLFIGCSMDDEELLQKLAEQDEIFASGTGPHFVLVKRSDNPLLKEKLKDSGVNFKFISFDDFGLPLLDQVNQISSCRNTHNDLPVTKLKPVEDGRRCQVALLYPQPLDNQLDFSGPLKEIKRLKADVHYYPLNLQRLNELDGMDYIIIFSHIVGDEIIIEDEYFCQEVIPINEVVNNIGNAESKGIFLMGDKSPSESFTAEIREPLMIVPKLDKKIVNKFIFHVFNKHINAFDFNEELQVFNEDKFILSKLTGKLKYNNISYETLLPSNVNVDQIQNIVGRQNDIENMVRKILKLTQTRSGCFTIKGAGGLGKTTCVLKSLSVLARDGRFSNGIRFIDSSPIRTFKALETELLSAFGLDGVLDALDIIENNEYCREDRLVILDNAETLLHVNDSLEIIIFLRKISAFCTLVTTSREVLGIEYGDPYELRHLNANEAKELFVRNSSIKNISTSDKYLLQNEILDDLLGNHPLAIKIIASTMPKGKSLTSLRDDLISSNDLFVNDYRAFFDGPENENIERQVSIFNCISYSYLQLKEDEKNVFNILSLFPDGLPLAQLKVIARKNNNLPDKTDSKQVYIPINDNVIKSLQDKSLIESRDGIQCQHAMLRRYAEEKIIQSDNKEALYKKAFRHNYALIDSLFDALMANIGGDSNNFVYSNANRLKNNFISVIRYYGCYSGDYDLQLEYLYSTAAVLQGCDFYQQLSQVVQAIPENFTSNIHDKLFLDITNLHLRYYDGDFIEAYKELKNILDSEDIMELDFSSVSNRRSARAATDIYEMEGDVVTSMKFSVLDYRLNSLTLIEYPSELFLIGEYDLKLVDYLPDSFTKFDVLFNLDNINISQVNKYCKEIYERDNIERMQCYYVLAKAGELEANILDTLNVVNPYTAGLKQLMLAWESVSVPEADDLYQMALSNLFHIKYYYVEALYYYCRFLKDHSKNRYLSEILRGKTLAGDYSYRFLLHKFIQLELGTDTSYQVENYPLSDDFPLDEYKNLAYSSMNKTFNS